MSSRNNPISAVQKKEQLPLPEKGGPFLLPNLPVPRKGTDEAWLIRCPAGFAIYWAVVIIGCFSVIFYYFFLRPYAYRWKPCNGMKEYGVCIPSGYDIHGIDISHYQGK